MAYDPPPCIGCGRPAAGAGSKVRRVEGLPVCDSCNLRPPPALLDEGFGQRPEFRRGLNISGALMIAAAIPWLVWLAVMGGTERLVIDGLNFSPELIDLALKFAGVGLLLCSAILSLMRRHWLPALTMGFSGMVLLVSSSLLELETALHNDAVDVLINIPGVVLAIIALATTSKRDFYPASQMPHRGPQVLPEGFRSYREYAGARRGAEVSGVLLFAACFILVAGLVASVTTPYYWDDTSPPWFWGHVALLAAGVAAAVLTGLLALAETRWNMVRWAPFLAVALIGGALISTPGLPASRGHHLYEQGWIALSWFIGLIVALISSGVLISVAQVFEPGRPNRRKLPFYQGTSVGIMLLAGEVAELHAVNCVAIWGYHLEDMRFYDMPWFQRVVDAVYVNVGWSVVLVAATFSAAWLLWKYGPRNEVLAVSFALGILAIWTFMLSPDGSSAYLTVFNVNALWLVLTAATAAVVQRLVERQTPGMPVVIHPTAGSVPYPVEIGAAGWTLRKGPKPR